MVEESVEHAFVDLAARRWVEAKLKAEELIAATEKGLEDCGPELAAGYQQEVRAALAEVQAALTAAVSAQEVGDAARLQAACAALDRVTQPMAERLMDRAMEMLLRKRGIIQ